MGKVEIVGKSSKLLQLPDISARSQNIVNCIVTMLHAGLSELWIAAGESDL
jgi:hypothetical protein